MRRVLTIQDLSCLGKCSITIALPVISAMGAETAVLPTALLSTHSLFDGFQKRDLADCLLPFAEHWKKIGVSFDIIYTGYLGSAELVDAVSEIIDLFKKENTVVFTDPAMGDHGRLYAGVDERLMTRYVSLCAKADYIVPNITEACMLTGTEYRTRYDEAYIAALAEKLCGTGAKSAVITGVSLSRGKTGYYGIEGGTGKHFSCQRGSVDASYHGTGDLFAGTAVGALALDKLPEEAFQIAAEYTALAIRAAKESGSDPRYGVHFESTIPDLIRMIQR